MRGQFVRGDGLVLPNNISLVGAQMILEAAFRNTVPTFYAALLVGAPASDMTLATMSEPTIGVNGYDRIAIERSTDGWPTSDSVGGERFISTDWLSWTATGGNFDKDIQRVALLGSGVETDSEYPVYALSSALPDAFRITPTTPLLQRQFKYQLFI